MIPYLYLPFLSLGPIPLDTHPTLVLAGLALGYFRFRALAPDPHRAAEFAFWGIAAGLAGAHLAYLAYTGWAAPGAISLHPLSGMLTLPGLFASLVVLCWRVRRWHAPVTELARWGEAAARAFPQAWLVVRTGCFLLHDTPGLPSTLPWAVRYPDTPRHDLALYELLWAAAILFYRGPRRTEVSIVTYGLTRLAIHPLRLDPHPLDLALSLAILLLALLTPRLIAALAGPHPLKYP